MTNPRPQTPNTDPVLGRNPAPERSLVEELGEVADDMRQLYTDFGLRPYEVFSVVVKWSGGERGRGTPQVVSQTPFLPTPKVEGISSVNRNLNAGGFVRRGEVRLTDVSPRYTADDIRLLFPRDLQAGEEHYIEVRVDQRDGVTRRARYVVSSVPERRADQFDWVVRMTKQDQDRRREGGAR